MKTSNHDNPLSQDVIEWFSTSDQEIIKNTLTDIAKENPELDEIFSNRFTISEHVALNNSNQDLARLVTLIVIISSLIDPFIAQSIIGKSFQQKCKNLLAAFGVNTNTYGTRSIEIEDSLFRNLFSKIRIEK